ncbi:MAG TPA: DEAD/DEAH box helicase family protein, partial [Elusimicrobiota bacterium]|nr:DEAD/DEAH box helicase family protein [Elusimicrobiota bacterium]
YPTLTDINILQIPSQPWDKQTVTKLQNAWRRVTIADPLLYRRFRSAGLELTPYEVDAINTLQTYLRRYHQALGVMATGTGKTIVAFEITKRLLAQHRQALHAGEDRGVVLFFVNNIRILQDAEKKIHDLYNGELTPGHIWGGQAVWDANTDIVFATPRSLLSGDESDPAMMHRIGELMKNRKIVAAISDEVHHLPASTYDEVFQRLRSHDRQADFLGLTATEVRRDEKKVRAYFGDRIGYFYSATDAVREGYLVEMDYTLEDSDLLKVLGLENAPGMLYDGHPDLDERYEELRYDSEFRLPFLLQDYLRRISADVDPRTLFICRGIPRAQLLAEYFSALGHPTASLTSKDRTANEELFNASYEAIRSGHWDPKSKFAGRPEPKIASAVHAIREGIDLPSVNHIHIVQDIDSPLAFVQVIGRGRRPAPYKTHLNAVDYVGIQRQEKKFKIFMQYANRSTVEDVKEVEEAAIPAAPPKAKIEAPAIVERPVEQPVVEVADPTALDQVPETIPDFFSEAFPRLQTIPVRRRRQMDAYLAYRCGFVDGTRPSIAQFRQHMATVAARIKQPFDKKVLNELRARFYMALQPNMDFNLKYFDVELARSEQYGYYITESDRNRAIFERIAYHLITSPASPSLEDVYRLFPEYSEANAGRIAARAANLRVLRGSVFALERPAMTQRLARDILGDQLFSELTTFDDRALYDESEIAEDGDSEDLVLFRAERPRWKGPGLPDPYETVRAQDRAIRYYLRHPIFKGRLTAQDFELGKKGQFRARLTSLGVIHKQRTAQVFFETLKKFVEPYLDAGVHHRQSEAEREHLAELLRVNARIQFPDASKIQVRQLKLIAEWQRRIENLLTQLGDAATDSDRAIAQDLQRFSLNLGRSEVLSEMPIGEYVFRILRGKSRVDFQVQLEKPGDLHPGSFGFLTVYDWFHQAHLATLTKPYGGFTWDIQTLERMYDSLSESDQSLLIQQISRWMLLVNEQLDDNVVFMVSSDPAPSEGATNKPHFFADQLDAQTDPDQPNPPYVIGP